MTATPDLGQESKETKGPDKKGYTGRHGNLENMDKREHDKCCTIKPVLLYGSEILDLFSVEKFQLRFTFYWSVLLELKREGRL